MPTFLGFAQGLIQVCKSTLCVGSKGSLSEGGCNACGSGGNFLRSCKSQCGMRRALNNVRFLRMGKSRFAWMEGGGGGSLDKWRYGATDTRLMQVAQTFIVLPCPQPNRGQLEKKKRPDRHLHP